MQKYQRQLVAGIVVSLMLACGKAAGSFGPDADRDTPPTAPTPTPPPPTAPPLTSGPIDRVFLVVEENASASTVIGGPQMPYLNSLATQFGLATESCANAHPSISNYFMLTVGNTVTNNNNFSGVVSDDNIVRQLLAAGKSWKSNAEDLPSVGYTGGDTASYARKHNVLALLADVVNSPAQVGNLVPFSQFSSDLTGDAFPNYSFIVPNLCNDGHDCPLTTADAWLQSNIGPAREQCPVPARRTAHRLVRRSARHRSDARRRPCCVGCRRPESQTWIPIGKRLSA